MSNLGPQQQNSSFDGLLQIPAGVTSDLQPVQDGMGNFTGLWLSSTGISITGLNVSDYANDAAAALAGIPIGGVYRNGNVLQIRIS